MLLLLQLLQELQLPQLLQPLQPQFEAAVLFKIPLPLLLNKRINSKKKNSRLSEQELLFKSKIIKKKNSKDELSKVFPQEQSFVKQLLHSIKEPPFNFY